MPLTIRFATLLIISCLALQTSGQVPLSRMDSITFIHGNTQLSNPFAGGLNLPQFSVLNLNGDGKADLYVFDRSGNIGLTFENQGATGQSKYAHRPAWQDSFPSGLASFAFLRDLNCDGKADLITAKRDFQMQVYENTSSGGGLSFQLWMDTLKSNINGTEQFLFVADMDIPGVDDIDGDGDLDFLTFNPPGSYLEYHKNMAVENGNCAVPAFELADGCWGKFEENAFNNSIALNVTCKGHGSYADYLAQGGSVHAGSAVLPFDEDGDGDMDVLLGDLLSNSLVYLHNGGSAGNAQIDTFAMDYPTNGNEVNIFMFLAPYKFDANNDGRLDLVVAPNAPNVSANYNSVWYYENTGTGNMSVFTQQTSAFLQEEMIDVGTMCYPVVFDATGDGKPDLLIGNYSKKLSNTNNKPGLTLYENTGTLAQPRFELVTDNYEQLSGNLGQFSFGYAPAVGDMDGDGDQDLIIGDDQGFVHYLENIASSGQPANFTTPVLSFMGIDIGANATPFIADIDGDGLNDLVIGQKEGTLNYFRNKGTASSPSFSSTPDIDDWGGIDVDPAPQSFGGFAVPFLHKNAANGKWQLWVGSEAGPVFYYADIDDHFTSNQFVLSSGAYADIYEGRRSAPHGADIDLDGTMEWVIGNIRGGLTILEPSTMTNTPRPVVFEASVKLFPNPGRESLGLSWEGLAGGRGSLELLNLQGQVLRRAVLNGQNGSLELPADRLAKGMYFVKIRDSRGASMTRKWLRN